ncbi:MAG TPA: CoA transferase, partial [Sphingomicrobium sp.]|nr:CoA transferase [Sphingomicrobium sp.]
WAEEPGYATNAARVANREMLVPMIAEIIAARPSADWLAEFEDAGIPAGPINSVTQALGDPQAVHRGVRISASGGALGEVPMVGSPIRIDGERQDADLPPPGLGEHGDCLREWVGDEELARLRADGIVS